MNMRSKEQSLLFDLSKAFSQIGFFRRKDLISYMCAQHVLSCHLTKVPWIVPNICHIYKKKINIVVYILFLIPFYDHIWIV